MSNNTSVYKLPLLSYSYQALEPYIDRRTMEVHHTKHHQGYVDKLNVACQQLKLNEMPMLEEFFKNIHEYPMAIRNNGGGHYNHSFFWSILSPRPKGQPTGDFVNALKEVFESIENFKKQFVQTASTHFGSGWCWLMLNNQKNLQIICTPNQDNPLMSTAVSQGIPLLGVDLWEHAYYLHYQNRRQAYLQAIWHVIDWAKVEMHYEQAFS